MRATWANILESAERIRSRLQASHGGHFQQSHSVDDTSDTAAHAIGLDLTLPIEPMAELSELPLPPEIMERISSALSDAISKLRTSCDAKFKEAYMQLSTSDAHAELLGKDELLLKFRETYQAIFLRQTNAWIKETKRLALSRVQQAGLQSIGESRAEDMHSVKRPFNQDYIPILEAFFTQEQFPSRADKLFLAKKSAMTYRQIHVWFQNRRSRTRKSPVDASLGRDSSYDTDTEETSVKSGFSSRASSFTLVADDHPFEAKPPPHAFPGKYPPDFDEKTDPFPCRFGNFSSFSKANWDRKPSTSPIRQDGTDTDVDALSEAFGKLRIRSTPISERAEVDYPRTWGSYSPRPFHGCDVMAAYTTRPFGAPIPSFIPYPHQERYLRPCTVFRPQHRDSVQTEPNVSSSRDDTPSSYKSATQKKRFNKPRLPKRVPTNHPKPTAMSKSMPDAVGLASTDETDSRTRGRTLLSPSEPVASLTRSASSSSDDSVPSLTPSISSSSSSEAQSPSSPAQGLPDESASCFLPELSTASTSDTSQGLFGDIPFPLFASSDFNYDSISNKTFSDNAYELAFSQPQADPFLSLQFHPPPVIPQCLPLSFDFPPLIL